MLRVLAWPLWWLGVLLSVASGVVFGWAPTHLDAFNPRHVDADLVSAGGYVGITLTLLGAWLCLEAFDGPRVAQRLSLAAAARTWCWA